MKKILGIFAVLLGCSAWAHAPAESEFCSGFAEGYKTVKGDMALVPLCPLEPLTPLGSTPFREGIKAGIRAANK